MPTENEDSGSWRVLSDYYEPAPGERTRAWAASERPALQALAPALQAPDAALTAETDREPTPVSRLPEAPVGGLGMTLWILWSILGLIGSGLSLLAAGWPGLIVVVLVIVAGIVRILR